MDDMKRLKEIDTVEFGQGTMLENSRIGSDQ